MSEKKKRKSGAGRKKGSVSFCLVPLTELNAKLPTGAIIVVSRKYCEAMSIEGQPVVSTPSMMMPMAVATKANAVQVTNLNDEETTPELSVDNW
jgi:hypothetical protein